MSAPLGPRRRLDPVHLLEDVGRQALDAVEIGHQVIPSGSRSTLASPRREASRSRPAHSGEAGAPASRSCPGARARRHGRVRRRSRGRRRRLGDAAWRRRPRLPPAAASISASAALTSAAVRAFSRARRSRTCRPGCSRSAGRVRATKSGVGAEVGPAPTPTTRSRTGFVSPEQARAAQDPHRGGETKGQCPAIGTFCFVPDCLGATSSHCRCSIAKMSEMRPAGKRAGSEGGSR